MNIAHQRHSSGDSVEPETLARLARLRYVSDEDAGYSRRQNGHENLYLTARGKQLRTPRELRRLEHLAIPPAWTDVWICRFATGHLQATGRDDRRRKQYLYHDRWSEFASIAKFVRIEQFGVELPKLRRAIARDLSGRGLTRTRVLAGMVALLDATSIRVGNEEYVRQNGSYGLATLRTRHVIETNRHVELRFKAKGGINREVVVDEQRLVGLMKQLKTLRGAHVFQYLDENEQIRLATSSDVNDYLLDAMGHPFTAKDFRTWKASALAAALLFNQPIVDTLQLRTRAIKNTLAEVAAALANTPAVCRKYYVHPGLLEGYEHGTFHQVIQQFKPQRKRLFGRDEQILAHFLRRWKPARKKSAVS
jgi:DNA topoisomerase I